MRKIIFILTIFATFSCKAQSPIISMVDFENDDDLELIEGCYLKDVENKLHPFVGIWEWTDGSNIFTVVIEKLELVYEPHTNTYSDFLIGKYKYVENGVNIINTLDNEVNASNMWNGAVVSMWNGGYDTDVLSRFNFKDFGKQKRGDVKIILTEYLTDIEGNIVPIKAQWSLKDKEKTPFTASDPSTYGFSVPTDVELTKQ
ncbi:MAG: hypothetical protein KBT58_12930 [Bizionia sp.]|nr:hypothetical protein [Bizionia sp.]